MIERFLLIAFDMEHIGTINFVLATAPSKRPDTDNWKREIYHNVNGLVNSSDSCVHILTIAEQMPNLSRAELTSAK